MKKRGAGPDWLSIFMPPADDYSHAALVERVRNLEAETEAVRHSLEAFTQAVNDCASQLRNHTGAIRGLAEASQDLKMSAAGMDQSLRLITEAVRRVEVRKEKE